MIRHVFSWLAVAALFCGCGRNDAQVYQVPKEVAAAKQPQMPPGHEQMTMPPGHDQMSLPPGHGGAGMEPPEKLTWPTPSHWEAANAEGMKVARFLIPGQDGQKAEVAAMPLKGMTAAKVDIVNVWRQQLELAPITEAQLPAQAEKIPVGTDTGELFDMAATKPLGGMKEPPRVVVAEVHRGDTAWYFKVTGPDSLVKAAKQDFQDSLKKVKFEAAPAAAAAAPAAPAAPSGMPPMASGMGMGMGMPGAGATPNRPQWQVPAGWQEQPAGQMVLAKYAIAGADNSKAEVAISAFPGDVGGTLANVNRWRGQIGLAPIAAEELDKNTQAVDTSAGKGTMVDLKGTSPRTGQPTRLVAVAVPQGGQTFFYKLMGDDKAVEGQKDALLKFLQTVKY